MAMTEEAKLNLVIAAQNQTAAAFGSITTSLSKMGTAIKGLVAGAAAVATVRAIKNIADTTVNAAMEVDRLSRSLGMSAEDASSLRMAADDLDLSVDGLISGMGIFAGQMKTVGEKDNVFTRLGISVREATGALKPTMTLLGDVADKFKAMPDGVAKLAAVRELFGRSGEQWLRFLNEGAAGIAKMGDDAEKMGLLFSAQRLEQIRDYKLAAGDAADAFEGLKVTIGSALLPVLAGLERGFIAVAQVTIGVLRRAFEAITPYAQALWSILTSVSSVVGRVVTAAKNAYYGFSQMSSGMKTASTALQWFLTLAKDVAQWATRVGDSADSIGRAIGEFWAKVKAGLSTGDLGDIWTPIIDGLRDPEFARKCGITLGAAISSAVSGIANLTGSAVELMGKLVDAMGKWAISPDGLAALVGSILDWFTNTVANIKEADMQKVGDALGDLLVKAVSAFLEAENAAKRIVVSVAAGIVQWLLSGGPVELIQAAEKLAAALLAGFLDAIFKPGNWDSLGQSMDKWAIENDAWLKRIGANLAEAAKEGFKRYFDFAIDPFGAFRDALIRWTEENHAEWTGIGGTIGHGILDAALSVLTLGLSNFDWTPEIGGNSGGSSGSGSPPSSHAVGGIFTGPTHLFGEAGAEAVVPLTPGNLTRYGGGFGSGGTQEVHFHFHGAVLGERDLRRQLTSMVKEGLFNDLRMQKQMA